MSSSASQIGRRHFLKHSTVGLGLGVGWPALFSRPATGAAEGSMSTSEDDESIILFQGDSVTDAGRSRDDDAPNQPSGLGNGYVNLAVSELLGEDPGSEWTCYNRGVGGDKVGQLAARWDEDCLALEPDVLSILVGVNDFWHTLSGNHDGTSETYEKKYRALLDRTLEALPDVTLLIGEPFALPGGTAVGSAWDPDFQPYQAAARRIADDYDATWIPYQSVFDEALQEAPAAHWAPDGVHPAPAGNYLMAQAWLEAFRNRSK